MPTLKIPASGLHGGWASGSSAGPCTLLCSRRTDPDSPESEGAACGRVELQTPAAC
jgi:hypothetical protein